MILIENCAQAHGSRSPSAKPAPGGYLASFSYYPTTNLDALGDGAAVAGSDPALMDKVRLLRQYGWRKRYVRELHGRNSRLDEIQAAILRVRLTRIDQEIATAMHLRNCI